MSAPHHAPAPADTAPLTEGFREELRDQGPAMLRVVTVLGVLNFAAVWVIDPLLASGPDLAAARVVRVGACVLFAVIFALTWVGDIARTHARVMSLVSLQVTAVGVILLTVFTGGTRSDYHEALYLTMFGYGMLQWPWRRYDAPVSYAVIIAVYVAGVVGTGRAEPWAPFLTHIVLLLLAAMIATVMHVFVHRARVADFVSRNKLARANEQLTALDEAKSRFFANLSHELRTPLTLTLAPLQTMIESKREPLSDGQREKLELAHRNALRLLRLVDDLLALTRSVAANLKLDVTELDVGALVRTLTTDIGPLAARKNLQLTVDIALGIPHVVADPALIERAILNYVANAAKFTRDGGHVTVAARALDGGVEVSVSDDGIGIPAHAVPQLFGRFFQVDGSSTRSFGGTGIGLSIVREIVELHGGRVSVDSQIGIGSRFAFWLPPHPPDSAIRRDDATGEHAKPSAETGLPEWHTQIRNAASYRFLSIEDATERRIAPRPRPKGPAPTVLVVEDNPDMIRFIVALMAHDYNVITAQSGATGLRLATERRPDVIVSDVMMPEMDGFELGRRLRTSPLTHHIPLIYLTARGTAEDRVVGHQEGAISYLAKPFRGEELMAAVESVVLRDRTVREAAGSRQDESIVFLASGMLDAMSPLVASLRRTTEQAERGDLSAAELERLRMTVTDVAGITDALNSFARAGVTAVERPAETAPTVRRVVDACLVHFTQPDRARVHFDLAPHLFVAANVDELVQMLTPIVMRALSVTPDGLNVFVSAAPSTPGRIAVQVVDEGPGLTPEHAQRLFLPFYLPSRAPAPGQPLEGLELALANRLAQARRGAIHVVTEGARGTRMIVELPSALQRAP